MLSPFTLIKKSQITHDVYQLTFTRQKWKVEYLYGQFVTFFLRSWSRSYSIASTDGLEYQFVIKRLENGKWGSKEICDTEIWTELKAVWPVWKFTLRDTNNSKMFLWTWTGFAPLYFQILWSYDLGLSSERKFIFWVREAKDIFYLEELENIKEKWNFSYEIYVSREEVVWYKYGRITEYITKENIENFQEFYICGSPAMVSEAKSKLLALWISSDMIFSEEY